MKPVLFLTRRIQVALKMLGEGTLKINPTTVL